MYTKHTFYHFFPFKTTAGTFGVLFREMLCPSLLRKEIGDLVLAINAAFSSAFRSRLSAGTNMINGDTANIHFRV